MISKQILSRLINQEEAETEEDLGKDGRNTEVRKGLIVYTGTRKNPEGKRPHGRPCVRKELFSSLVYHTICCQVL
jgi:hypothetical protein